MKALQRQRVATLATNAAGVFGWRLPASASSAFSQSPNEVTSWPYGNTSPASKGYWKFTNSDTPMIRVRCYGMGAGDAASDAAHNDTDYHRVE